MRLARRGVAFAALAALALVTACGSDNNNGGTGTPQDLTGTYNITSYEQQVNGQYVEIPGVAGTIVLTATTYAASLQNLPVIGDLVDQGTYTAVGSPTSGEFTQNSTLPGGTQATGTYQQNTTTGVLILTTVVNSVGQRITVQKQGV